MTLVLVPIPPICLDQTQGTWLPYVQAIAERAKNDPNEMARMLYAGEAQAFLVWDAEDRKAQAFIGVEYKVSTQGRVAQIIWLMGEDRKRWVHLIAELEGYLRTEQRCVIVRPICRRGWSKMLKAHGYRETHVVMEKTL